MESAAASGSMNTEDHRSYIKTETLCDKNATQIVVNDKTWSYRLWTIVEIGVHEWRHPSCPQPKESWWVQPEVKQISAYDLWRIIMTDRSMQNKCDSKLLSWFLVKIVHKNVQELSWLDPYSPDMSPPDFNIFPKFKESMCEHHLLTWKNFLQQLFKIPAVKFLTLFN